MSFEQHLRETVGSSHTVTAYVRDAQEFEAFLSGRRPSVTILEEWVRSLNHGAHRPQTVQRHLTAARRWLAWRAVHESDAESERVLTILHSGYKVSPPVRQSDRREVHAVTEDEYARIMGAAGVRRPTKALLSFLWWSGARTSEAIGDPAAGIPVLSVLDGILLWHQGWTRTVGKGGKIRVLILPQSGRNEIEPQIFRLLGGGVSTGEGSRVLTADAVRHLAETPLFPSVRGRPRSKQSVNRSLHRAASLLGIRKFGAHALRHAYKARLRRAGVEAETIRRLMGHGPADVTEAYGREEVDELLAAVQKLEVSV